ncbi:hypothetical protein B0H34DRAFT_806233 [Crassisporium funariophilum]|nr:hypothetical protein B0H34DRAFT_806233 [Crassisporium funariophilum]
MPQMASFNPMGESQTIMDHTQKTLGARAVFYEFYSLQASMIVLAPVAQSLALLPSSLALRKKKLEHAVGTTKVDWEVEVEEVVVPHFRAGVIEATFVPGIVRLRDWDWSRRCIRRSSHPPRLHLTKVLLGRTTHPTVSIGQWNLLLDDFDDSERRHAGEDGGRRIKHRFSQGAKDGQGIRLYHAAAQLSADLPSRGLRRRVEY